MRNGALSASVAVAHGKQTNVAIPLETSEGGHKWPVVVCTFFVFTAAHVACGDEQSWNVSVYTIVLVMIITLCLVHFCFCSGFVLMLV